MVLFIAEVLIALMENQDVRLLNTFWLSSGLEDNRGEVCQLDPNVTYCFPISHGLGEWSLGILRVDNDNHATITTFDTYLPENAPRRMFHETRLREWLNARMRDVTLMATASVCVSLVLPLQC